MRFIIKIRNIQKYFELKVSYIVNALINVKFALSFFGWFYVC
mgnify:FL=1